MNENYKNSLHTQKTKTEKNANFSFVFCVLATLLMNEKKI